jgi:hypothetical protein
MPAPHRPDRPWEPEALRLPLEAPQRRTRRPASLPPVPVDPAGSPASDCDDDAPSGADLPGSHVVVIDIG